MKTYQSPTSNGGKTYILDDLTEAIDVGKAAILTQLEKYQTQLDMDPDLKIKVTQFNRDNGKTKTVVKNLATFVKDVKTKVVSYNECVEAITKGDQKQREAINQLSEQLRDMALDLQPTLSSTHQGWTHAEEGIDISPELLAQGDPSCCLRRRPGGDTAKDGEGDGAYRIIINTDVAWWGKPEDNAAVMGALVMLLQNARPVEIWIQQGWMGGNVGDGVTLFKLDFQGAFEPTQLAFWIGHPHKDSSFSYCISRGCGRVATSTSINAELPCDLYLRGDWMTLCGLTSEMLQNMTHYQKLDAMAKWISSTAVKLIYKENSDDSFPA